MGRAIGIDLGTTNSVMAVRKAKMEIILNAEVEELTPSVVAYHKGKLLVGAPARECIGSTHEGDVIVGIKRFMGRAFSHPHVQRAREKSLYEVLPAPDGNEDDVRVRMGPRQYSPIEISAEILGKIKRDAELREGTSIDRAVVTVPAYFSDRQREATRRAAIQAGLRVLRILPEPSAAAIAFGVDNVSEDEARYILVYDFGGGTFDVSVLTWAGGAYAELDIEGDMWLGGADLDGLIVDYVEATLRRESGIDISQITRGERGRLHLAAERAKKQLTTQTRADIAVSLKVNGEIVDLDVELTRVAFEGMIAPLIQRSVDIVRRALDEAHLVPSDIDHVLLVGGSSQVPAVRRALEGVFGAERIRMDVDPMRCVAIGAAILAANLEEVECPHGHTNAAESTVCATCGSALVPVLPEPGTSVLPVAFGIGGHEDKFLEIVPKGTPVPLTEPMAAQFMTPAANLRRLRIPVYSGEDKVASQNQKEAVFWLELPDGVPENARVEIALDVGADGLIETIHVRLMDMVGVELRAAFGRDGERDVLEVRAETLGNRIAALHDKLGSDDLTSAERAHASVLAALNRGDLTGARDALSQLGATLDRSAEGEGPEWKRKALGLCTWTEIALSEYSILLDPAQAVAARTGVEALRARCAADDEKGAQPLYETLDKLTDEFPRVVFGLMTLVAAIGRALERHDDVRAEQLRAAKVAIDNAMRANDPETVVSTFKRIEPVMQAVLSSDPRPESRTGHVKGMT